MTSRRVSTGETDFGNCFDGLLQEPLVSGFDLQSVKQVNECMRVGRIVEYTHQCAPLVWDTFYFPQIPQLTVANDMSRKQFVFDSAEFMEPDDSIL